MTSLPFWRSVCWTQEKGHWVLRDNRFLPRASFQSSLWALYTLPSALPETHWSGFWSFCRDRLSFTISPSTGPRVLICPRLSSLLFLPYPSPACGFRSYLPLGCLYKRHPPLSPLILSARCQLHKAAWMCHGEPQLSTWGCPPPHARPASVAPPGIRSPETEPLVSSAIPAPGYIA